MRTLLIIALLALLLGVGLVALIQSDPGYILIAMGRYTVESSLWVGLPLILMVSYLLFALLRLLFHLVTGRHRLASWWGARLGDRAQRNTAQGLISFVEGHWSLARRQLLRGAQVADVRGEVGRGELALAGAEAREVEAQHRHAHPRQVGGDAARGQQVLRAGEAVGEQGVGADRPVRQVEPRGPKGAGVAGELELLDAGGHPVPSRGQAASGRRRRTRASRRSLRQKRVFSGSG